MDGILNEDDNDGVNDDDDDDEDDRGMVIFPVVITLLLLQLLVMLFLTLILVLLSTVLISSIVHVREVNSSDGCAVTDPNPDAMIILYFLCLFQPRDSTVPIGSNNEYNLINVYICSGAKS